MIANALWITLAGMGGVFAFLIILIVGMIYLHELVYKTTSSNKEKIAVAIAVAQSQEV